MDNHNFILPVVSKYLVASDLIVLLQVSKYFKKNINIRSYFEKMTTLEFSKFYKILRDPSSISLNTSSDKILNQVPLFINFVTKPDTYKQFVNEILNNCYHPDNHPDNHSVNRENGKCDLCYSISDAYTKHINNIHIFPLLNKPESFIVTVLMSLYH